MRFASNLLEGLALPVLVLVGVPQLEQLFLRQLVLLLQVLHLLIGVRHLGLELHPQPGLQHTASAHCERFRGQHRQHFEKENSKL
jgi:hypothetical protein